jgi:DNA polymerase III subunit delta
MKATKSNVTGLVERPNPKTRFYLLFGPDESQSRGLAKRLRAALKAEKVALTGADMKGDAGRLVGEASAISMFGEPRLLWIEPAGEDIAAAVGQLLDAGAVECPAVAIGGAFKKTSALRKMAEAHPLALAFEAWPLEGRDADRLAIDLGAREGLRIAPPLAARIAAAANADQGVMAQEVAKYALYLGASATAPVDLHEEVFEALGADTGDSNATRPGDLALAGDSARLSEELERLEGAGIDPVTVLRALQRRLLGLAPLRARVEAGQPVSAVMASVWGRDKDAVAAILPRWRSDRLAQAIERVSRLERAIMANVVEPRAALGEELLGLARAGGR